MTNKQNTDSGPAGVVQMDWQQVVLNGGPPCFAVLDDEPGWYCGRAGRWDGHDGEHEFVSLERLLARTRASQPQATAVWDEAIKIAKAEAFERRMAYCVVDALEAAKTRAVAQGEDEVSKEEKNKV